VLNKLPLKNNIIFREIIQKIVEKSFQAIKLSAI
jgi:hypothetical protein